MGLGNILRRDEGVGVILLEELKKEESLRRYKVEFIDGGTASHEALYEVQPVDFLIIIDALKDKGSPGSLHIIKPEDLFSEQMVDLHQINLLQALKWMRMEGRLPEVLIFGIEVKNVSWGEGLSSEIGQKLPVIKERIVQEIENVLSKRGEFAALK